MDRFPHSSAPLRKVKGIQFGIMDPNFLVPLFTLSTYYPPSLSSEIESLSQHDSHSLDVRAWSGLKEAGRDFSTSSV